MADDFTTKHPADAIEAELTAGQRITRNLFPEMAQRQDQRVCVRCQKLQPPEAQATWSEAGRREWNISGMCEPCFDEAFAEPDIPTLTNTTELQLERSAAALAADAASNERTYGDHCYFGGGRLDFVAEPEPIMFTLNHPHTQKITTDETSCRPCFDRVLRKMVRESLDSAEANGYDLRELDPSDIAADIATYDGSLDQMPPKLMEPFIAEWVEEGRIAKAERGADREA